MTSKIKLSKKSQEQYKIINNNVQNAIGNLAKLNIFIGANNSGKSRLLRNIFGNAEFMHLPNHIDVTNFSDELKNLITRLSDFNKARSIFSTRNIESELKAIDQEIWFDNGLKTFNVKFPEALINIKDRRREIVEFYKNKDPFRGVEITHLLNKIEDFVTSYNEELKTAVQKDLIHKRYYIPILRSLKHPQSIGGSSDRSDIFSKKTIDDYFANKNDHEDEYNVSESLLYTGLTFYDDIKLLTGSGKDIRFKKDDFQNFLSKSFFNNRKVEITAENNGRTLILIDEEEYPVRHLGDGIQSIIILTYPLFMHQGENAIFFFEEPETHLHPGFQRLFIETLKRPEFESFQYFITTHSNHFLDISLEDNDVSIYTFEKKKENNNTTFRIENVAKGDDNVLQLIGANNSSVFLSNCTVWVEGITDRIYLRKYLDLYQESIGNGKDIMLYKEDIHYSFVEYGGSNITHWSFLDSDDVSHKNINVDRLCGKSFVLTDSDNAGLNKNGSPSKKLIRQNNLEKKLGRQRYHCLSAKEIEKCN